MKNINSLLIPMLLAIFAQSALAAESAPTDDNLDISNLTAQVVWSKKHDHTLVAHYDPQSQLYWALPVGVDPKGALTNEQLLSVFRSKSSSKTNSDT